MSKTVTTPKGRLSYPHLFEKNESGEYASGMYECLLLIPKSADISSLKDLAEAVAKDKFGDKFKGLDKFKHPPIRDGDEYEDDRAGHWVIKAKTKVRPQIVGADPSIAINDSEEVYGGRHAKLSLSCYAYDTSGNKGVAFTLRNVQLLPGGERFGGGSGDPTLQFSVEEEDDTVHF